MGGLTGENRLWIALIAALAGALLVIAAQFMDYTGFQIGAGGIESANEVAPRPTAYQAGVGSDQLWIGIPVGLAVLVALRVAIRSRQWRLGRSVAAAGALMLVLTLVILLPNATDGAATSELGDLASVYEGVEEQLLAGFWFQLVGSLALIGGGAGMVRSSPAPQRRERRPG